MVFFSISFLLALVFNLDSFTHMHVQGMFVTEKSGCLRVPSSDLNINIYKNGKNNKSILRIPYLHIRKKKKSLFFCANVLRLCTVPQPSLNRVTLTGG